MGILFRYCFLPVFQEQIPDLFDFWDWNHFFCDFEISNSSIIRGSYCYFGSWQSKPKLLEEITSHSDRKIGKYFLPILLGTLTHNYIN
jgi:hypothetical protein